MRGRIIVPVLVFLVLLSVVSAPDEGMPDMNVISGMSCEEIMAKIDMVGQQIPSGVPFQNELVNLMITEEGLEGHIEIVDGKIVAVDCGLSEEATFDLAVKDFETLEEIGQEENPVDAYNEMRKSGEITIEATGFGKKIKLFFTNAIAKIASWFI